jgi:hypothetical protein
MWWLDFFSSAAFPADRDQLLQEFGGERETSSRFFFCGLTCIFIVKVEGSITLNGVPADCFVLKVGMFLPRAILLFSEVVSLFEGVRLCGGG